MLRIIPTWLVPIVALGLTMLAFAEGAFDALPDPPMESEPGQALAEADRLYREGQVTLALSHLQRAGEAIGETSTILIGIARCQLRLGRYREAEQSLGEAIEARLRELGYDPERIRKVLEQGRAARDTIERADSVRQASNPFGLSASLSFEKRYATQASRPIAPADLALASQLSDGIVSVALTDLARVELARAHQWSRVRGLEPPMVFAASMHEPSDAAPRAVREEELRRQRARRLLSAALEAAPGNPEAKRLWQHSLAGSQEGQEAG